MTFYEAVKPEVLSKPPGDDRISLSLPLPSTNENPEFFLQFYIDFMPMEE